MKYVATVCLVLIVAAAVLFAGHVYRQEEQFRELRESAAEYGIDARDYDNKEDVQKAIDEIKRIISEEEAQGVGTDEERIRRQTLHKALLYNINIAAMSYEETRNYVAAAEQGVPAIIGTVLNNVPGLERDGEKGLFWITVFGDGSEAMMFNNVIAFADMNTPVYMKDTGEVISIRDLLESSEVEIVLGGIDDIHKKPERITAKEIRVITLRRR